MSIDPTPLENITWRTSLTCESAGCVGVARQGDFVIVRSTSNLEAPVSKFTLEEWGHFLAGVKQGDFDDLALERQEVTP